MISTILRRQFLDFFKKKGHTVIPSSPVIPHDDPSLLFANAGMNQFKDVFLGKSVRDYKRVATVQKCIRVGGKHNDLENVGHTTRHLTFFEMLGNFSFGDYFKKEAIAFAWEMVTTVFGYDTEKVWASVFENDDESYELWKSYLPEKRIARLGEKDNFWAMGETGPCGPCSELLYDRGPFFGDARSPKEDTSGERYFEFWNLVFMEFNRESPEKLIPLAKKSVDTGAGLERVVQLKMQVPSIFETDILRTLIAKTENLSGYAYNAETAPAFQVIADHVRALAFACADGAVPSNTERGYVLRKILRRALRYGRQIGLDQPFLASLLPTLTSLMGDDFPELKVSESKAAELLTREEENFQRTLRRGGNLLNQIIQEAKGHRNQISGEDVFKLKDTYGLPLEEIELLAKDASLTVDKQKFVKLEEEAKERSRLARKSTKEQVADTFYADFLTTHSPSRFVGYNQLNAHAEIEAIWKDREEVETLSLGEKGGILLNQTPFYAEKGGQVGDKGTLIAPHFRFEVEDTKMPYPGVLLHLGEVTEGKIGRGERVTALVDGRRRKKIANNHTATHLLHYALQEVLGKGVTQAGSLVDSHRLRFDFNHHAPLKEKEIEEIENIINAKIREDTHVVTYEIPLEEASKQKEIKQFFGEKYGEQVRVVDIGYSKELCGGTHAHSVGSIGYFRIVKEGGIAAGIRRIEAVTGEDAEAFAREAEAIVKQISTEGKIPTDKLVDKFKALVNEIKTLQEKVELLEKKSLAVEVENLLAHIEPIGEVSLLAQEIPFESSKLPLFADILFAKKKNLIAFLLSKENGRCSFLLRVSSELTSQGYHAGNLLKEIAPILEGKGGGKADNAQGGGNASQKANEAFSRLKKLIAK